jgi:hypothetical protein
VRRSYRLSPGPPSALRQAIAWLPSSAIMSIVTMAIPCGSGPALFKAYAPATMMHLNSVRSARATALQLERMAGQFRLCTQRTAGGFLRGREGDCWEHGTRLPVGRKDFATFPQKRFLRQNASDNEG